MVPQVMSLRDSRERAEQVFLMRSHGQSWSKISRDLGFTSVGGAQRAYERYLARNPLPDAETVRAEIVARKKLSTSALVSSLAAAMRQGDHQAGAALVRTLNAVDAELAKLLGLNAPDRVEAVVATTTTDKLNELEQALLRTIEGEVAP